MKKTLLLFSCCAFLYACNSGDESKTEEGDDAYYQSPDADSAAAAAASSSARQSEVDTNTMNIGTDRTAGVAAATTQFEKGEKLIAQSDCLACHKVDEKLVGPSYAEVAQKYENNDKNVDYLAGKIIEGGAGVWGEIPMTPHPDLSKEDAREMARYVLSLKK